jgi:hypothetical protein
MEKITAFGFLSTYKLEEALNAIFMFKEKISLKGHPEKTQYTGLSEKKLERMGLNQRCFAEVIRLCEVKNMLLESESDIFDDERAWNIKTLLQD